MRGLIKQESRHFISVLYLQLIGLAKAEAGVASTLGSVCFANKRAGYGWPSKVGEGKKG
jgi:hypothetical protein